MARYMQMRIFYIWFAVIMLPVISSGVSASQHKEAESKALAGHQIGLAKAPDVFISSNYLSILMMMPLRKYITLNVQPAK
jgi:hypothetical protein